MAMHNTNNVIKNPRQSGKTLLIALYAVWYSLFNSNTTLGIMMNKLEACKYVRDQIMGIVKRLPKFMQMDLQVNNKSNNANIRFCSAGQYLTATRGMTFNRFLFDEFAFYGKDKFEDMLKSLLPTMYSGRTSRITLISTRDSGGVMDDIFFKNNSIFRSIEVLVENLSCYSKEWKQRMIDLIGEDAWELEYGNYK